MTAQTLRYIKLANSTGSLSKRFRVQFQDLAAGFQAQRTLNRGAAGNLLGQQGSRARAWSLILKVYHTDPNAADGYGNRADLETLFNLNNPAISPSDVITFQDLVDADGDNTGDSYSVLFVNQGLFFMPMSPMLTGVNAWFTVPINLGQI